MNKYKHLTLEDRSTIENGLNLGQSFKQLGIAINKDCTTISKEIKKHTKFLQTGAWGRPFNDCINRYNCNATFLCNTCISHKPKYCKFCSKSCSKFCELYQKEICTKLLKPPYTCNSCSNKKYCTLEKRIYSATYSYNEYKTLLSDSRSSVHSSEEEILRIDSLLSKFLKQGLSLHAICVNHKDELMVEERTLYNYVDSGILSVRNIDLPRKIRYRKRKSQEEKFKVDKTCRIGRTYQDYLNFIKDNPDLPIVQMDSVEGVKGGKTLLTLHFTTPKLMLAFIRDSNTSKSVTDIFEQLYYELGKENFRKLFGVILTDNGSEFSNPTAIEFDKNNNRRTFVFYCDAGRPDQKAAIENNHEFIRKIIPKGTSMDNLNQEEINLMMNHINSYVRKDLGDNTPYQIFKTIYDEKILKKLDLKLIPPNDIVLKPTLLN